MGRCTQHCGRNGYSARSEASAALSPQTTVGRPRSRCQPIRRPPHPPRPPRPRRPPCQHRPHRPKGRLQRERRVRLVMRVSRRDHLGDRGYRPAANIAKHSQTTTSRLRVHYVCCPARVTYAWVLSGHVSPGRGPRAGPCSSRLRFASRKPMS